MTIDPMPRQDLQTPPPVGFVTLEYHNASLHAAKTDAKVATALVIEQAASTGYRICAETRHVTLGRQVEDAIRSLAPTAGIEGLAALRAEIDDLKLNMDADLKTMIREGAALKAAEADRDRLAAENADLQRRVEGLEHLRDVVERGPYRGQLMDVWIREVMAKAAVLTPADPPTEYERKVAQMKEDFPNGI